MSKTAAMRTALSAAITALCALALSGSALAQSAAPANKVSEPANVVQGDVSGTYQCKPDPNPCLWSGSSPSISRSGQKIEVKNDKGEIADGMMTSDTTLSVGGPLNSLGIVRPDHSIDWSGGTKWNKH
jgi:hypothetical protein